ncbi:MAG: radical SAM protein [Candidatus Methanoplasma sp.]|nr:radical SAM protein [Candidatus Methanoplasma sp.]
MLLYSTLTTSVVTLSGSEYEDIFVNRDFSSHPRECSKLREMGFLFDGDPCAQSERLSALRGKHIEKSGGQMALTISPTTECNARCHYCFERGIEQAKMSVETADLLVEFIDRELTGREISISWFGGEPLLATDVIDRIVRQLNSRGISIKSSVTTNGSLIDDGVLAKFREWNVERVQITVDSIGEEYNRIKDYIGLGGDPFSIVMENIGKVVRTGVVTYLRVNYGDRQSDAAKKTSDYLSKAFGSSPNVYVYCASLFMPDLERDPEYSDRCDRELLGILKGPLETGEISEEVGHHAGMDLARGDANLALRQVMMMPFPVPCYAVDKMRFSVDSRGSIYKCHRHTGRESLSCGNVADGVIANDVYRHFVSAEPSDPECAHCFMYPVCLGGCPSNVLLTGEKHSCPPTKSIAKELVRAYYDYLARLRR